MTKYLVIMTILLSLLNIEIIAKTNRGAKIVAAEYSINDIGTAGKGIPIIVSSSLKTDINIGEINLEKGDRIYLRVKNEFGVWSNSYCFHYSEFIGLKSRNRNIDYSESIKSISTLEKQGQEIPITSPKLVVDLQTTLNMSEGELLFLRIKNAGNVWSYPVPVEFNKWFGLKIRNSKINKSELFATLNDIDNSGIDIPIGIPDYKVNLSINDVVFGRDITKYLLVKNEAGTWSAPVLIEHKPHFGLIERNKKISGAEYVVPANTDIENGKGTSANVEDLGLLKKSSFAIPFNDPGTRLNFRFKNERNIWSNSVYVVNNVQGKIINLPGIAKAMNFDGYRDGSLYFSTDSVGCFGLDTIFFRFQGITGIWSNDSAFTHLCSEKFSIVGDNNVCQSSAYKYFTDKKPNTTFAWTVDGGTINGVKNADTVNIKWTKTGISYLKLVVKTDGKSDSTQISVNINLIPTINIVGENWVMPNANAYYSVDYDNNHACLWSINGGEIIGVKNTNSVNVKWGASGIGTISLSKTNNITKCEGKSSLIVTINLNPAPKVSLVIPDTTANPKEQFSQFFSIPIYLTEKPTSFNPTSVTINLHIRKSIFLPRYDEYYDDGDFRYITITKLVSNLKLYSPIVNLTGTVLLADVESSPIVIDQITWIGAQAQTSVINGSLILTGINSNGYQRLIKNTNQFSIVNISPNPANSLVKLDVIGYEQTNTKIRISNTLGETCYISDFDIQKGFNHLEIDKITTFETGIYQLSIISENSIETKPLLIVR